jgi:hypothetical protein
LTGAAAEVCAPYLSTKPNAMKRIAIISSGLLLLLLTLYGGGHAYNYYLRNRPPSLTTSRHANDIVWVPFRWAAGEYSDREALYIPVRIDTITNKFYLQFDLGILRTKITSLTRGFPYLRQFTTDGKYNQLPVYLGNNERHLFNEHSPIDYQLTKPDDFIAKDTSALVKIGDAGYDYIKGRIFICDFRHARYALTDTLTQAVDRQVSWINSPNVQANQWPIHIPVKINQQERTFFYDNGSSQFTLFLTRRFWNKVTDNGSNGPVDSLKLSSWGTYYWYIRAKPVQTITSMFGEDMSHKKVFYGTQLNETIHALWNHVEGIDGLMGNEYFRDKVLVIDTKANRIGIFN